jgi:AcrR family transcriptional regulator
LEFAFVDTPSKPSLKARKQPVQARSEATVVAILDASIQVLVAVGYRKFTTTLVAERAGTSIGTLYQYFPNREALMVAVLVRYIEEVIGEIDTDCRDLDGKPVVELVPAWVNAFVSAKCRRLDVARAMHEPLSDVAAERQKLVRTLIGRTVLTIAKNLEACPDSPRGDHLLHAQFIVQTCSSVLQAAVADRAIPLDQELLSSHLVSLVGGYLRERSGMKLQKT